MANYYITNYGNDNNNGLSFDTPWRNLTMMNNIRSHRNYYYLDGYFTGFESINRLYIRYIYGINNTKINGNNSYRTDHQYCELYNLELFNFKVFAERIVLQVENCYFHDIYKLYNYASHSSANFKNCVFKNVNYISQAGVPQYSNNTFFVCQYIYVGNYIKQNNIFYDCSINIFNKCDIRRSLFMNCSFRFYGGGLGNDESTAIYPIGVTGEEKLQNLRDRMSTVYGGNANDYLFNCIYYTGSYNDIFVDADNDDFGLVQGCIAEHMSNFGSYIGAKKVTVKSNINQSSLINVSTSGYIINQLNDAEYISETLDIGSVKKIKKFNIINELSVHNGFQINYDSTLGTIFNQGEDVLTNDNLYTVLSNNIKIDNASEDIYTTYDTFIASAETPIDEYHGNGLGFKEYCFEQGIYGTCGTNGSIIISDQECGTNGQVQEVIYENNMKKIKILTSKTDSTLNSSTELLMKISEEPKVNVNILGEPIIGNADSSFDESNAVSLYTRYIKLNINIKSNNIPIR